MRKLSDEQMAEVFEAYNPGYASASTATKRWIEEHVGAAVDRVLGMVSLDLPDDIAEEERRWFMATGVFDEAGGFHADKALVELRDYAMFGSEVSRVYDALTVGRISKPNTKAEHVIAAVEEYHERDIELALKEARAEWEEEVDLENLSKGLDGAIEARNVEFARAEAAEKERDELAAEVERLKAELAQRPATEQPRAWKPGDDAHVAFWDAVNAYAKTYRHDTYAGVDRQKAVVGVEDALRALAPVASEQPPKAEVELPTEASVRDAVSEALIESNEFANIPRHDRVSCYDAVTAVVMGLLRQHSRADQAEEIARLRAELADALKFCSARLEAEAEVARLRAELAEEKKYLLSDDERRKLTGDALQAEAELAKLRAEHARMREAARALFSACGDTAMLRDEGWGGTADAIDRMHSLLEDAEPKPEAPQPHSEGVPLTVPADPGETYTPIAMAIAPVREHDPEDPNTDFFAQMDMLAEKDARTREAEKASKDAHSVEPQPGIARLAGDVEALKESLETNWEHIECLKAAVVELCRQSHEFVSSIDVASQRRANALAKLVATDGEVKP